MSDIACHHIPMIRAAWNCQNFGELNLGHEHGLIGQTLLDILDKMLTEQSSHEGFGWIKKGTSKT